MKKRVLSMLMALALCLTLLPTAAWAEELEALNGTPSASVADADAEAGAQNGGDAAGQNGEDGVSVQSGGDGIAVQAASAEKTESSVASVVIDGTTSYYDTLNEAIAAAYNANNDAPLTVTMLNDVAELNNSNSSPRSSATIEMGGKSLGYLWFLNKTLTLKNGVIQGHTHLRSGGGLVLTAPAGAAAAIDGSLNIVYTLGEGSGTANVSGAKIGVKGTLRVESSAANAVVISGSEKAVELDSEVYLSSGGRFYGSAEENGSPDTVAVFDAGQKTYTVDGATAKKLVSGPKAVVAVTPGDALSVMAGEAQEYTAQFTAEGVVSGSVKGLGDLQATVENGDANGITVDVAENAADGTWKVTVQTAESTPKGTYTLNLSSKEDSAVSGSVQFTVSETKYAASVNGTNYRSLSAAIDAAKNVNGTVTLLDNVTDSITVTDGTFTIDLNGKTWTGASNSRALTVNGGEVTLSSTGAVGTIVGSDHNKYAVWVDSGTVHLKKNVKLTERLFIKDENGGSVTFEPGVTVTKNIMTSSHSVVRFLDGLALQNASKGYVPFYNVPTNRNPLGYVTVVDHPAHHMVDGVCDQCGYVCGHSNARAEDTVCPDCGAAFIAAATAADGTVTRYTNADAALAAAAGNAKVTFVPGTYTLKNMTMLYGSAEIDLQGATLQYASDYNGAVLWMEDNSVSATIKNGIIQNIGEGTGIYLYRGSTLTLEDVTVIGDTYKKYSGYSINVANFGNTLTVKSGSFSGPLNLKLANNTVKLYGGTYQNGIKTYDKTAKDYAALLDNSDPAKQYAYADGDGSVITYDEVATRMNDSDSTNNSIQVKEHTHTMGEANTCTECGFVCTAHQYKNGVCAICKAECPHANVDTSTRVCSDCGLTMVAAVTVKGSESGSVTTYAADLPAAMSAAEDGTKITLLADVPIPNRTGISGDNTTVTLDLNGHKITSGWLDVGNGKSPTACTLKIIGKGSYEPPLYGGIITVNMKATLDLSEWEGGTISSINISDNSNYEAATREAAVIVGPKAGTIGNLSFGNNQLDKLKKTKLSGGSFNEIWVADFGPVKLGELLADGYAYQNADGSYVKYETTLQGASIYNVKVVKCLHPNMKPDAATGVATCEYCGKSGKFAASVDGNLYSDSDMDEAISYWLANGGTLKLYADYTAADGTWSIGSGSHTINLNGHMMSVQDDSAFKPTNNMHLTVTDGTELGQITNIRLDGSQGGSFTLESGIVGNLEMTDGAVVALKGGSVDKLDVLNSSANTNLSIQGGSIGELNIKDWANGMHVSATGGSLGAYNLPSDKILADVLDHQYYAEGTSLDKRVDAVAQKWEKFDIKQAPHDFGSTSKAADVPINGSIPFMVDSPSGDATGYYDVRWYRRTDNGAVHMTENKVAGVNVGDTLDVFCVITGLDKPNNGTVLWQVAVKGYTLQTLPPSLENAEIRFADGGQERTFWPDPANHSVGKTEMSSSLGHYTVMLGGKTLTEGTDYQVISGNVATGIGTYDLTIKGIAPNYSGTKTAQWTVVPHPLGTYKISPIKKQYDGTVALPDGAFPGNFYPMDPYLPDITLREGTDYVVTDARFDTPDASNENKAYRYTVELKNPNYVFANGTKVQTWVYGVDINATIEITKADAPAAREGALEVINNHADTYTVDLSALLPALEAPREYGAVTYGAPTVNLSSGYYTDGARVEDGKLILPIRAVETKETGSIGSVKVKVSTTNYHDFTLTINVNATNKIVPTGEPTLSTKTLTYGQALSAIKLSGKLHDNVNNKDVEGTFTWVDGTVKPSAGSYEAAWKFTPADGDTYTEADGTVTITVNKAKPTGDPIYTRITAANKTLADANLKPNTSWPTGTVKWVGADGKDLDDTTEVKANTAYKWVFTPSAENAANYTTATGELTLYSVSTGGGGGGSSSGSTVKTGTVTNPDGSVTKTETKSDGTVVETTTGKDGSTTKTETKKDGSSVTETKAADGSTGTVKTDKHGQTTAETTLSSKAIENAKKNGEAVKAPVEVEASRDSSTAPTVKIELPRNSGDTKVEIPVTNVKPGTVAVLVHPDGTEEILKDSIPTEDGIQLTVDDGATVKIVDNSKGFIDTRNHWAEDEIDFVSARGLVNGMSATIYAPNASTTRAQLWTILARQNDADLTGGSVWYEKAQNWAKTKGVSDGANPNAAINRAQMVTMLYRAAGSPEVSITTTFTDVPADSYYAKAVAWAVENGITTGVGSGKFDPNGTCTRAQIATFLYRLYLSR